MMIDLSITMNLDVRMVFVITILSSYWLCDSGLILFVVDCAGGIAEVLIFVGLPETEKGMLDV